MKSNIVSVLSLSIMALAVVSVPKITSMGGS